MPSKSAKQEKTMRAAFHNPAFRRKVGIPKAVARKYHEADQKNKRRRRPKRRGDMPVRATTPINVRNLRR